jgi:hypothetical protein
MAILNSIQRLMNGYGNGSCYVTASGVALSTTSPVTTAVTLANSGFTQGYSNGIIRVKIYNGGGTSPTFTVGVTVSDGTNTVTVFPTTTAIAIGATAAGGCDLYIDVNVDIAISVVNIITTGGGTTPTASMDYEIDLNP